MKVSKEPLDHTEPLDPARAIMGRRALEAHAAAGYKDGAECAEADRLRQAQAAVAGVDLNRPIEQLVEDAAQIEAEQMQREAAERELYGFNTSSNIEQIRYILEELNANIQEFPDARQMCAMMAMHALICTYKPIAVIGETLSEERTTKLCRYAWQIADAMHAASGQDTAPGDLVV
jgi:hypothetical protein